MVFDSYGQIDAVRYTFNLEVPVLKLKLSHTWEWEPKANQVTFTSTDKDGQAGQGYVQAHRTSSQPDSVKNQVDPAFINDNYWFLLRFIFTGTPALR